MTRRILITGSSRGLGRAIALRLAQQDWQLVLHGRAPSAALDATIQAVRAISAHPVEAVCFDVGDEAACRQYAAIRRAGLRIPEDISLISFDNAPWLRPYPISSVDFGTEALGYDAFQLFYKLVSIHIGQKRLLQGRNRLVNRGSLAPPAHRSTTAH